MNLSQIRELRRRVYPNLKRKVEMPICADAVNTPNGCKLVYWGDDEGVLKPIEAATAAEAERALIEYVESTPELARRVRRVKRGRCKHPILVMDVTY